MSRLYDNPFYQKVFYYRFSIDTGTGHACKNIMQHLFAAENLTVNTKLYLDFLRTKVSKKVDNEDFFYGVYMLVRSDFGILVEKFEALNEDTGIFEEFMPEDAHQMIKEKKFFNPFNGRALTDEETENQLRLYFTPTTAFIKSLKKLDI